MVNKGFISPKFMQKNKNKQNSYLLLAFVQSGSVPELDVYESKHFLPGQFVHSVKARRRQLRLMLLYKISNNQGRIQGEAHPAPPPPPPKIGKNMIFRRKIVIFHTKYPKMFRASLHSAQFV